MKRGLVSWYHTLPPPARSLAAAVRGLYLEWWRYGPETERLIEEATERERWTPERWRVWREERLAYVLHRAATQVPYYRDAWAVRRRKRDRTSWEVLENWPVLEKEVVRISPRAFIADDCPARRMLGIATSGTTGTPLQLWRSRRTLRALYAIAMARTRRWYDVRRDARWARIGGQLVTPAAQRRPPFWVWNPAGRQLYLSALHLAPDLIPFYLDALRQYRVVALHGYPSCLHLLAQSALALGRDDLVMRAVITSAEPLLVHQREAIAGAFASPVQETYGMAENVAAASTCNYGSMHQWCEVGHVEVLEGEHQVAPGASGDLVCTSLLDADMPLIRYRVGDRARLPSVLSACPCGRSLPVIEAIEGRIRDVLISRDGRQVASFGPVFHRVPIREAQILQESLDRVRIRYVADPGFGRSARELLVSRVQDRLGEVSVVFEEVPVLPRSANGKLQVVRCCLDSQERRAALPSPPHVG